MSLLSIKTVAATFGQLFQNWATSNNSKLKTINLYIENIIMLSTFLEMFRPNPCLVVTAKNDPICDRTMLLLA